MSDEKQFFGEAGAVMVLISVILLCALLCKALLSSTLLGLVETKPFLTLFIQRVVEKTFFKE